MPLLPRRVISSLAHALDYRQQVMQQIEEEADPIPAVEYVGISLDEEVEVLLELDPIGAMAEADNAILWEELIACSCSRLQARIVAVASSSGAWLLVPCA